MSVCSLLHPRPPPRTHRPSRALGSVAAPDGVASDVGRGDAAAAHAERAEWRRLTAPTPERLRLQAKLDEVGVCEACTQRRADTWKELSGLHTKLQTTLAVGSTAVLPDSWSAPVLIGGGIVGDDGLAMPGPPAHWQLGSAPARCSCCPGGEHERGEHRTRRRSSAA